MSDGVVFQSFPTCTRVISRACVRGLSGAADKLIGCCRGTRSFIEMRCHSMPNAMESGSLFSSTYARMVSKN